ncbi:uncharacterized protein LOC135197209 [Macrobrachium nipponense]|uniref:uncharacterized protein LOC135197209 n=1 Tax=Macrobrachium nipponense TaxID=159736 RepID=UPI0030C7CB5F
MAEKPGYGKVEDNGFGDETDAYGDPPPAYNETAMSPMKGDQSSAPPQPYPPGVGFPSPQGHYLPPIPQPAPVQVIVPPAAPAVSNVVVEMSHLPPGTCTVCRKGQIKDSASCCTWFWCCLLLPLGILPGIIAFCCCCRRPKCNHCGFSI